MNISFISAQGYLTEMHINRRSTPENSIHDRNANMKAIHDAPRIDRVT